MWDGGNGGKRVKVRRGEGGRGVLQNIGPKAHLLPLLTAVCMIWLPLTI